MFGYFSHYLLGACLTLMGWNLAIEAEAGLPICAPGCSPLVNGGAGCTLHVWDGPFQLTPETCFVPIRTPSEFDVLLCQSVQVGEVVVSTPCYDDLTAWEDMPYVFRAQSSEINCNEWQYGEGMCDTPTPYPLPVVCKPADELAGDCQAWKDTHGGSAPQQWWVDLQDGGVP